MVRISVKGTVYSTNPKKLWVIPLKLKGINHPKITSISGIIVLRHRAVPSNFFGYFIFSINAGA